MKYLSNLHTHTPFCDGKNTAEEMVRHAIELGYESIGFSGHSYTPFDPEPSMSEKGTEEYAAEIIRLKGKYRGKIEIYLGIELDIFSKKNDFPFDYVIGSAHYLNMDGNYVTVDDTYAIAESITNEYFGGDWLAYAEAYYATVKDVAEVTECDIVGHFDLVTKFNENSKCFDENSERYRAAAIDAMRHVMRRCNVFEVNTGAIYRKKRSTPYPAEFLLRELNKMGGEIVFSSDSHDAEGLGFRFEEAAETAKKCGFKYAKILRGGKFEDVRL